VVDATSGRRPQWRADAAYLVTGGLGEVAGYVTAEMVRQGARRLVLLGRTPLPPRTEWSHVSAETSMGQRIAAVRRLEQLGAAVHLLHADVADEAQLGAALAQYAAEGWPPIRGVVHAAGIMDNRLVAEMDSDTFHRVLAPKLTGARNLERLLPDLELFIAFSSFTGFVPQAGTSNYAAANVALDALMLNRRARGLHGLSV
jgi:NAD(P)-dependent dehydrogenase (short-subunit alcohol dehydrogenase family)